VPYIPDDAIERDAEALLAQFAYARDVELKAPVPIEDIVEKHLKLRVEFNDLHRLLGVPRGGFGSEPDIFGAIWLETGEIVIDESLDPEERPAMEGRYRFTLGHEGGGPGDCTVLSFKRMAIKTRSSAKRGSRPLFADRAKQGAGRVAGGPILFVPSSPAQAGSAGMA
jgi:hypothetical protein